MNLPHMLQKYSCMSRRLLLIGKEECVQDDARRLIQRATGAKRRHLARGNPSGVVTHKSRLRRFACDTCLRTSSCTFNSRPQAQGLRRSCACQKKTRRSVSFLFGRMRDSNPANGVRVRCATVTQIPKLPQRRNASIIIAGLAHLSSVIFQKSAKAANFFRAGFSLSQELFPRAAAKPAAACGISAFDKEIRLVFTSRVHAWNRPRCAILSFENSIWERILRDETKISEPAPGSYGACSIASALRAGACRHAGVSGSRRQHRRHQALHGRSSDYRSDEDAPAQRAGLRAGDTILKIDGACVSSAADAVRQLSGGKSVRLLVQRGQKQAEFFLTPEKTQQGYRLGVSVRDNISGIGTITFYDPETGVCGALGHGVTGLSGTQPLAATGGILCLRSSQASKKACAARRASSMGAFDVSDGARLCLAERNARHFRNANTALPQSESVPVADASQIPTGAATILANVDGKETREYCVRIDKLYPQAENGRNLLITVTDERLLEKTGGIVQGMSGSPISAGRQTRRRGHACAGQPPRAGLRHFHADHAPQCEAPVAVREAYKPPGNLFSYGSLTLPFLHALCRLFSLVVLRDFHHLLIHLDRPRTFWRICTTARS